MKISTYHCASWLSGFASLLAACQPQHSPDRLAAMPLLEAVPAGYCPIARQDTLRSYWAPPAALANPAFDYFAPGNLSEVVLRVGLVPASAARRARLDTLAFHPVAADHGADGKGHEGLNWFLDLGPRTLTAALLDAQGEPTKVFSTPLYPLVVTEERRQDARHRYARNRYSTEYPFYPLAMAHRGDSVIYVRAYLLRGNVPRTDTVYRASATTALRQLPHEVSLVDTTRLALLRISLRQVRHSATPAGY